MIQIPKDPYILLSFINTKLRDEYSSFEELCDSLSLDKEKLAAVLLSIQYEYSKEINQFKPIL